MSSMDCNTTFPPSDWRVFGYHGKNPPFVVLHPISRKKTEKVTDFSKKIFLNLIISCFWENFQSFLKS